MKKQVPLTPVLAIALVIVAVAGYFGVIAPKQARSAELDGQIAELETKLAVAERQKAPAAAPKVEIDVADVFRLAKAMPDQDDLPGQILELNSIALSTGVKFLAIQPSEPVSRGAYYALPVVLTFEGNYYDLTDFLFRLRNLVNVRDGVLDASGRLYTLDAIEFQEGAGGFPNIKAVLTVSAYSYGAAPATAAAAAAAPAATTTTGTAATTTGATTTGATTTTTTTTSAPASDGNQQAAGGTP